MVSYYRTIVTLYLKCTVFAQYGVWQSDRRPDGRTRRCRKDSVARVKTNYHWHSIDDDDDEDDCDDDDDDDGDDKTKAQLCILCTFNLMIMMTTTPITRI